MILEDLCQEPEDLAEIEAPEQFPGERLIVCRNPLLAAERARKCFDLLDATERDLSRIVKWIWQYKVTF